MFVAESLLTHISALLHRLYNGNPVGQQFGPKCNRGDRIGCGIYADTFNAGLTTVFFTKNGKEVSLTDLFLILVFLSVPVTVLSLIK